MATPYLVIVVELFGLICTGMLALCHRYIGEMIGGRAFISPSIDSKNHIHVAGTVILSPLG